MRTPMGGRGVLAVASLLAFAAVGSDPADPAHAQTFVPAPTPGYYDSTAGLTGPALREALHDIIDDQRRLSDSELWSTVTAADGVAAPLGFVLTLYADDFRPAGDHRATPRPSPGWHREHVWPVSRAATVPETCDDHERDAHHIFAEDPGYNLNRANTDFDWCLSNCPPWIAMRSQQPNKLSTAANTWEVWPGRRGDVARAMLYMDVRYQGGPRPGSCYDPDLILANAFPSPIPAGSAYMLRLSTILTWHCIDPVDDKERLRNEVVFAAQGNRNPFVDAPAWVEDVWSATCTVVLLPTVP